MAEALGVQHCGAYYDHSGALRDMFQNHMLQMLAVIAMEPPITFEADSVRDEKNKLLRSLRPLTEDTVGQYFVRGQPKAPWLPPCATSSSSYSITWGAARTDWSTCTDLNAP
ncbi:MAG: hypothetical protein GY809_01705 [Planctomycetes bacterium]|nr:hypothetical protein [Planctomycetota bacterium]